MEGGKSLSTVINESPPDSEDQPFLWTNRLERRKSSSWLPYFHWVVTIILALLCIGQFINHRSSELGSYEKGFKTELTSMTPAISLEQKTFHFYASKEDSTHREYVGPRTPERDHSWNRLLHPGNLDLTDEEAGPKVWNTTWKWEDTKYWFSGISMWHQLHCVNQLREIVRWDQYNGEPTPEIQYHLDHCIDYLRQVIMCYGDMTPMRYAWDEGMGRLMLQDEPHVCRNYEKMNEWASPRASCHVPFPHQPADVIAKPRGSCVRGPYYADE